MSIGEEVLFKVERAAALPRRSQNSIPRTRNENFLLKSSYESNHLPAGALRAVGLGGLPASQKRRLLKKCRSIKILTRLVAEIIIELAVSQAHRRGSPPTTWKAPGTANRIAIRAEAED
jgi:hypothetical protein